MLECRSGMLPEDAVRETLADVCEREAVQSRNITHTPAPVLVSQQQQHLKAKKNSQEAKEWAEIFLNSNYLAGIRQRGINGGTRSIRFQRCVLEAQVISSRQALHKPTGAI
ncbi:hypothetical protein Q8A67_008323 [Cirrhinus molitorella]|uniref:Uncharacterized protein n=1 Tax=Cirrhinus molitorella TaxID=172907 RepID=A0AA88TSP0_9TELE|nr:hypothetical protein Q8A67_008323 [Cirrhinus molitorella]